MKLIEETYELEKVNYPRYKGIRIQLKRYLKSGFHSIYLGLYDAFADPLILFKRLFSMREVDKAVRPQAKWYEEIPENPNNIAIIMTHGFGGTPEMFHEVSKYYSEAGYYVRVVRLSGHGTTVGHLAQTSGTEWLASVVWHYKEVAKQYDRIYFIGHSIGGTLGMIAATLYKFEGVIAMSSPINLHIPPAILARQISIFIKFWPRSRKKQKVIDETQFITYRKTPLYASAAVFEIGEVLRERADKLTVPTLYIKSGKDKKSFQDQHEIFRRTFNNSEKTIKVAENTEHSVFLGPEKMQIVEWTLDWIKLIRLNNE